VKQNSDANDQRIESLLKDMPKIQDEQNMDDLFSKIEGRLDDATRTAKKRKKRGWFVPSLATAAVLFVGVLLSSQIWNQNSDKSADIMQIENIEGSLPESSQLPPANNDQIQGFAGFESDDNRANSTILNDPETFLGLNFTMNYQNVIEIMGAPLTESDSQNIRSLFYTENGAGIKLKFNMKDGSIFEYTFFPEYLRDGEGASLIPYQLPETIQEVKQMLGDNFQGQSETCYENTTCDVYLYELGNSRFIEVYFSWDNETVDYIRFYTTDLTQG
jgi:hypothetical protein